LALYGPFPWVRRWEVGFWLILSESEEYKFFRFFEGWIFIEIRRARAKNSNLQQALVISTMGLKVFLSFHRYFGQVSYAGKLQLAN
jgi:hypothetical protein